MPEILINVRPGQTRVAYLDEKVITDFKVQRKTLPTFVGSIYKGKVLRVLPGMQAAFVDIGLDKAAFLYVGDIVTQGLKVDADISDENEDEEVVLKRFDNQGFENISLPPIQTLISSGDELMVQVAKDPLGTKGARITTHITLPGRNLVYMPTVNHIGVSRKIENEGERKRLEDLVLSLKPTGGVIIRTAGEGAPKDSLNSDLVYLSKIWKDVKKNYANKKNIGQVHSEISMELVSLRDLLNEDVKRVLVDHQPTFKKVVHFVGQFMPKLKSKVQLYSDSKPLFDLYDIDIEISRSLGRKVWLKSGGYIVIDEAEALVVIDVQTPVLDGPQQGIALHDLSLRYGKGTVPPELRRIGFRVGPELLHVIGGGKQPARTFIFQRIGRITGHGLALIEVGNGIVPIQCQIA